MERVPRITLLWTLFFLAAVGMAVRGARAEKIKEIVLPDGGELSAQRVSDLLGATVGEEASEAQLEEGLVRLSNTGRFQALQVNFDEKSGRVVLEGRLYDVLEETELRTPGEKPAPALLSVITHDVAEVTALGRGDRVSLDQIGEIRERVLQRLRDRGFKDVQIVIALEAGKIAADKNMLVSARLGEQEKASQLEFRGFRGSELRKFRDMMEETEYVVPYLKKLDVPPEIVDRPEDYLLSQFRRFRSADRGRPVSFDVDFPLDWMLINGTLNEWGQRMRAQGYFDSHLQANVVEGKEGGPKLVLTLDRGPHYNVQFVGNVNFWERALRAKVLDRPMRLGLPLNLTETQSQIRSMYLAEGYKDVKMEVRSEDRGEERRIEFRVNEGKRYYLGKILWDGLSPREVEILQSIEKEWSSRMSSPFHATYFDERSLRAQMPQLLALIQAQGFLQARLLGFKAVPGVRGERMDLEVPMQLGPRFTLRDVVVEGQHPLTDRELDRIVSLQPHDLANADRVLGIAETLKREIQEEGFLSPTVTSKLEDIVTYSDTSDEVDLKYVVDMGPQVKVGQIVVDGLRKTKEKVVLREFKRAHMTSDEVWVPSKLEDVDQKLLSYGLFTNLRIQDAGDHEVKAAASPAEKSASHDGEVERRDIRVLVTERPGGSVEFGPGYRTDLGIVAFGEYDYRNLGGMNRSVVLRAQASHKLKNYQFIEQTYSLNYLEPYILDFPWSFRVGSAFEKLDKVTYDRDGAPNGGYNKTQASLSFTLGKDFTPHVSLSENLYTISNPKISDLRGDPATAASFYRVATLGPTLTFDYRDNIFSPSRGSIFTTAFEYASPKLGSTETVHYLLSRNEFSNYQPLRKGLVFATSFAYSHTNALAGAKSLPIDRRLVLGGRSSIRSLQEQALQFLQPDVSAQDSALFKAEVRQDLFNGLGFAYFFDMGRVDAKSFSGEGWRRALGIGLRYATPVGPLALDFAFNANQKPGEDFSRILFSVGVF